MLVNFTKRNLIVMFLLSSLMGCAAVDGQNQYHHNDVGQSTIVEFGTIITVREVGITGRNTGTGGLIGASAGAIAGSNDLATAIGGAIVGAVIGNVAEQAIADDKGIEYTITKTDGRTITLVQNLKKEDKILSPGQRVAVQTSGSYQRVLPAAHLPTQVKRPKGIKLVD